MSPHHLQQKLPDVEAWINCTLAAHAARARPVSDLGFKRLGSYFSGALLESARVISAARLPVPPLSGLGLDGFSEFERLEAAGITYGSCFFLCHGFERDESLHFHELVHVLQWRHLGFERFMMAYALGFLRNGGYRNNPLEVMAYDLQARFDRGGPAFDVAALVLPELDQIVPSLLQYVSALG